MHKAGGGSSSQIAFDPDSENDSSEDCRDVFGVESDESHDDQPAVLANCTAQRMGSLGSQRGKHTQRGRRLPHREYAARARETALNNSVGVKCTDGVCPYGMLCGRNFTPAQLIAAQERVYGRHCGRDAYNSAYHDPAFPEQETLRQKRALVLSWVKRSASDTSITTESFSVENQGPVCEDFARTAYHFEENTWKRYLAAARAGRLQIEHDSQEADSSVRMVLSDARGNQRSFEAVEWWVLWLRLEDQAPNEPLIFHRTASWSVVHTDEYSRDIRTWSTGEPLGRSRWLTLRTTALEQLSVECYGQVSDCDRHDVRLSAQQLELLLGGGGFGVPVIKLGLRMRGKKSNFGSCKGCDAAKAKWLAYRRGERTAGDPAMIKQEIFQHYSEVKQERTNAMQWQIACSARLDWVFSLDDKCGSNFLYLPAPPGGRFTSFYEGGACHATPHTMCHTMHTPTHAAHAAHTPHRTSTPNTTRRLTVVCHVPCAAWQYRFALQVNIFDNELTRMSLVAPCLKTGYNFGTTAFWSSLVRRCEVTDAGVAHLYRQTDAGPDNECQETHAFHVSLVSCGATNRLTWLQLRPKHSHNKCDRYNSMVKEVIWPQKGMGGGCSAPWDMEGVVEKALCTQTGKKELAWHWFNYDFRFAMKPLINPNFKFKHFSEFRLWEYEYDPELPEHHFVRVTYRSDLLENHNSREPQYKPYTFDSEGNITTKREGHLFMMPGAFFNPYGPAPAREAWKPAEKNTAEGADQVVDEHNRPVKPWSMEKVPSTVVCTPVRTPARRIHPVLPCTAACR